MTKKIGIIGSGNVGQSLGNGFIKYGYDVKIGSRSPEKLNDWKSKTGNKGSVGSFEETAAFGDIIVLATLGSAAENALLLAGAANTKGKIIIDATNPISSEGHVNGVLKFFTTLEDSLMERLQRKFITARFVKAFNSVGAHLMVDPDFDGLKPSMFICGNDDTAKKEVSDILDQFGWEVEDMGQVEAARAIEPLCILWCIPGFKKNQWYQAFKFLKK